MYLEKIGGPEDIKKLTVTQLKTLADETRTLLIDRLSQTGGHVGPNLGVVELTVALHYVFDSPKDKIIWDVSHQCYAHKILTGRREAFSDPAKYKSVTGFSNPSESEHDPFIIGHTSTSVSLALGTAIGRDLSGGKENVIAIIGDGSLSGGEAFEGFNAAGEYKNNLIIIINDNDQSIAENHGGIYRKLKELRESSGRCADNPFCALGFEYRYLGDGHDMQKTVELLNAVKGISHPVVLHICTVKGKGLEYAEKDRENWHSHAPFNIVDGSYKNGDPVYDRTVHDSITELLENRERSVIFAAGTPRAMGFVGEEREDLEKQGRFVDVGIAEATAITAATAAAKCGSSAVAGIYGAFLQRAYDQLSHDMCLNKAPATILVFLPGVFGMKSNTHLGICDIQMLSHIPDLVYLCPSCREEYRQMFRYATSQNEHPTAIRVPVRFIDSGVEDNTDYSVKNKAKIENSGTGAAIIATGPLIPLAKEIAIEYKRRCGSEITVINPRFLTGLDEQLLGRLKEDHGIVITIEDGEVDGGYGERVASFYGTSDMKVINLGISKEFHSDFIAEKLLEKNGISVDNIIKLICENMEE